MAVKSKTALKTINYRLVPGRLFAGTNYIDEMLYIRP